MPSLQKCSLSVNAMSDITDVRGYLERSVALHRAAQVLADASRCRQGLKPVSLNQMPSTEAAFYRVTVRHVIEIFEELTSGQTLPQDAELRWIERDAAISIQRSRARVIALGFHHDLGGWRPLPGQFDEETHCRRCRRVARIRVHQGQTLHTETEGAALAEPCDGPMPVDERER